MKRYFLFGFDEYYPAGGMNDFKGDFVDFNEMFDFIKNEECQSDYYEAFDTKENIRLYYDELKKGFVQ
ncbi:hypothetical protein Q8G28_17740 [Lysinibacillus capsici]|uniref:hypothetical protein n=1 Tax=Lysinibacillus capsici TaxID=2115968 RepID=UPI00272FC85C|nr:hypothetical protein [Lysinibacillus capsici]MDP1395268.1 hypothetical protein [Lysinibacillus capsici]MDP1415733.1 hypothetical protein [Lysinibacillus capsici]MDP1431587.1 hypothetical protein [Lysinibacillus capsici]